MTSGNRMGTRWRGKLPIPTNTHPIVRDLFREMNRQQTTITEVADRSGICRETISGWRYSRMPRLDLIDAAFNVLGKRLVVKEAPIE